MRQKVKFRQLQFHCFTLILILYISSCTISPRPIHYGNDNCGYCDMTIMDQRYGTEIVTEKGKIYTFDSIECLVRFMQNKLTEGEKVKLIQLTSFNNPGVLFTAEKAFVLFSSDLPSPMGMYLTAFDNKAEAGAAEEKHNGRLFAWKEFLEDFDHLDTSQLK